MSLFHFLFLFGQTALSTEHTQSVAGLCQDLTVSRQELAATRQAMVCLLLLLLLAGWPAGCFVIRTVADPLGGTMAGILVG